MTKIRLISALVATALAVTPALAAGVTVGNHGPSEVPVSRAAPFALPGQAIPKPTPRVDAAAISRGFLDLSGAEALDGLSTLTLTPDGSVTESPASDALRAIFETEMEGSQGNT